LRDGTGAVGAFLVDYEPPLRDRALEALCREPAVVAVQIIGGDQYVTRIRKRLVFQRLMRTTGPVQPRRPVIRAREVDGRFFEHADGVAVTAVLVRPPADLPGGFLCVAARGEFV